MKYDDVSLSLSPDKQKELAFIDIKDGFKKWRIWFMLAYQDIKLRYRRSTLGPFWLTISMAITVYSMGFLYAHLFRTEMQTYYPYLVAGMLTWALISNLLIDLVDTYSASVGLIRQIRLPYSLHIHRTVTRNVIIFFHNLLVIIPIYIIFWPTAHPTWYTLLLLPSLLIIYLLSLSFGLMLAMVGARYRDISQIIKSLVQVIFFITPIMWNPLVLPEAQRKLVFLNPFYALVELIREPLLGKLPTALTYLTILSLTCFSCVLAVYMLIRYRSRVVYWV